MESSQPPRLTPLLSSVSQKEASDEQERQMRKREGGRRQCEGGDGGRLLLERGEWRWLWREPEIARQTSTSTGWVGPGRVGLGLDELERGPGQAGLGWAGPGFRLCSAGRVCCRGRAAVPFAASSRMQYSLTPKRRAYDRGISLSIDTPFCNLIS